MSRYEPKRKEILKKGEDGFAYLDLEHVGYRTVGEAIRDIQKHRIENWVIVRNASGLYDICAKPDTGGESLTKAIESVIEGIRSEKRRQ